MRPRRGGVLLTAALAATLAGCDSGSKSATATPAPTLDAQLIPPAQVGTGIVVQQVQGGHSVAGQVTLDLCGFPYTSEALRTGRVQVNFLDPRIDRVAASEEIVQYSRGGAGRAFTELRTATSQCPASYQTAGASPVTISHVTVEPADPRLLPSQVAVSMLVTLPGGGTAWAVSIYQFLGDQMAAIYTGRPDKPGALTEALDLAPIAAARLRAANGG